MAHLCFCGCGMKVVTPLSPTGWALTFEGRGVSVTPSVGNWNLKCRSHYVISGNRIEWTGGLDNRTDRCGICSRSRRRRRATTDSPEAVSPAANVPAQERAQAQPLVQSSRVFLPVKPRRLLRGSTADFGLKHAPTSATYSGLSPARLLQRSRDQRTDFQILLTRYALERLLYRLSRSEHRNRFILHAGRQGAPEVD